MTAIGIFDSGVGGLTVLRAMRAMLPRESFLYLGDTARVPYGSKSPTTIQKYLQQNLRFLESQGVRAVVVACNSASTVLEGEEWQGIPVYGVIEPGARAAIAAGKTRRIGVLGTRATIQSGAYSRSIKRLDPTIEVIAQPCPLLVPLVEEGWENEAVTRSILARYLADPLSQHPDTLILGCTHYPVLKHAISAIAGPQISLIDSAQVMADRIVADLASGRIQSNPGLARTRVLFTDTSEAFLEVAHRILTPFQVDEWVLTDTNLEPTGEE